MLKSSMSFKYFFTIFIFAGAGNISIYIKKNINILEYIRSFIPDIKSFIPDVKSFIPDMSFIVFRFNPDIPFNNKSNLTGDSISSITNVKCDLVSVNISTFNTLLHSVPNINSNIVDLLINASHGIEHGLLLAITNFLICSINCVDVSNIKSSYNSFIDKSKSIYTEPKKFLDNLYNDHILSNLHINNNLQVKITNIRFDVAGFHTRNQEFRSFNTNRTSFRPYSQQYIELDNNINTIINNRLRARPLIQSLDNETINLETLLSRLRELGANYVPIQNDATLNLDEVNPLYHREVQEIHNNIHNTYNRADTLLRNIAQLMGENRAIHELRFGNQDVIDTMDLQIEMLRIFNRCSILPWRVYMDILNQFKVNYINAYFLR